MAPWSLAFLPDGKMLVTERYGFIRVASMNGFYSAPIAGVPDTKIVAAESLHDVEIDPDFAKNRLIYFTYFAPPPGEASGRSMSSTATCGKPLSPSAARCEWARSG